MEGMGDCGQLTGMEHVLGALLVCLFWVVVVRVDDLAEKSLLLFLASDQAIPVEIGDIVQGNGCCD